MSWKKITIKNDLASEIQRRFKTDQDARRRLMETQYSTEAVEAMRSVDEDNAQWIQQHVEKNGMPGKSQVGEANARAAWALVQHHPNVNFQAKVLDMMKAAPPGEHHPHDLALLTDRVQVNRGEPQTYGTQSFSEDGGKTFKKYPMIEPEKVDERRKSLGLDTLAEYESRY